MSRNPESQQIGATALKGCLTQGRQEAKKDKTWGESATFVEIIKALTQSYAEAALW
jgi:hypothetical protein